MPAEPTGGMRARGPGHRGGDVRATDRPGSSRSLLRVDELEVRIAPRVRRQRYPHGTLQYSLASPPAFSRNEHPRAGYHGVSYFAPAVSLATVPCFARPRETGLPISTFQGSYKNRGSTPFVCPGEPAWEAQRPLADRTGTSRETKSLRVQRARPRAVRFPAGWRENFRRRASCGRRLRSSDVRCGTGPSNRRPHPADTGGTASRDQGGRGAPVAATVAGRPQTNRSRQRNAPAIPRPARASVWPTTIDASACDAQRHRLATGSPCTPAHGCVVPVSASAPQRIRVSHVLGARRGYYSIALSRTGADVEIIVRIGPDGTPRGKDPCPERIWIPAATPALAAQIVSPDRARGYPSRTGPRRSDAPARPRCVLINRGHYGAILGTRTARNPRSNQSLPDRAT